LVVSNAFGFSSFLFCRCAPLVLSAQAGNLLYFLLLSLVSMGFLTSFNMPQAVGPSKSLYFFCPCLLFQMWKASCFSLKKKPAAAPIFLLIFKVNPASPKKAKSPLQACCLQGAYIIVAGFDL
jgi:hypothetical protein